MNHFVSYSSIESLKLATWNKIRNYKITRSAIVDFVSGAIQIQRPVKNMTNSDHCDHKFK